MKPGVARLFREARRKIGGNHTDLGGGGLSPAEITVVVEDNLAMLQAEFAGQPYSNAEHRCALLPRLNPVRTAAAVKYKHQNISAAMIDLKHAPRVAAVLSSTACLSMLYLGKVIEHIALWLGAG